jgi:Leucine-rich repeat (LRR) protein
VCKLKKLEVLDLSYNKIVKIPEQLGDLKRTLKFINMRGNPLPPKEQKRIKYLLPDTEFEF